MPKKRVITAAEMDLMTPNERAAAVLAGHVRDLKDVDEPFLSRVIAKAAEIDNRLTSQR